MKVTADEDQSLKADKVADCLAVYDKSFNASDAVKQVVLADLNRKPQLFDSVYKHVEIQKCGKRISKIECRDMYISN